MLPSGNAGDSCETAGDKPEEGGDDVKSSCPLCPGLHTCYIGAYKGLRYREVERIPKSASRFGLEAETRLHEGGVASNRESRSEEHTSELQSRQYLVCRLLLEKKKKKCYDSLF